MRLVETTIVVACVTLAMIGCSPQDPRVPLDEAQRDINDIRTCQLQADRLRPLQADIERALLEDSRVQNPRVGTYFQSSACRLFGARLVVDYVILLELKRDRMPSTQPDELVKYVQDLVRKALADCGWEIEEVNTYFYDNAWRIRGQIRGAGKPFLAGSGLDLLPDSRPSGG